MLSVKSRTFWGANNGKSGQFPEAKNRPTASESEQVWSFPLIG